MLLTTVRMVQDPQVKSSFPVTWHQLDLAQVKAALQALGPEYRSHKDRVRKLIKQQINCNYFILKPCTHSLNQVSNGTFIIFVELYHCSHGHLKRF
jgi:hypothetical protein